MKKNNFPVDYIVGIDEVGRGPLAGPIAFTGVALPINFKAKNFGKKIRDSKMLSPLKRQEIFCELLKLKKEKKINFEYCFESAKKIDHINIAKAGNLCIKKVLQKLNVNPKKCLVLLDGGIKAPKEFIYQRTIIGGDKKERSISFASIIAKVKRDEYMCKIAKKYPEYCFEIHKGYGTKKHIEMIKKFGLCEIHRKTFCKNINISK